MLKLILHLIFFSVSTQLLSQSEKGGINKIKIDQSLFDYAEISPYVTTKKSSRPKRINNSLALDFIKGWNSSKSITKCPETYQYKISIYFKDYSRRSFNLNSSIVGEERNVCINIGDAKLASKLWKAK